eukprot:TRINITY_DN15_c0_g1_i2.p1 TRINITY_DN15_c0_g1~~TRINITY_DN15_c0_g1_i2.p1  ORF type:complete len:131 (+),score=35.34 TRINITY_DN15_c0_g1_i2:130-522(+)
MEEEFGPPEVKVWQNTYRTEPKEEKRFSQVKVRQVVQKILGETVVGMTYHPEEATKTVKEVSRQIQLAVNKLDFENYKIVVQVTIGQLRGQGGRITSRCLWDKDNDNFVSVSVKNSSLFCTALVFGCYSE